MTRFCRRIFIRYVQNRKAGKPSAFIRNWISKETIFRQFRNFSFLVETWSQNYRWTLQTYFAMALDGIYLYPFIWYLKLRNFWICLFIFFRIKKSEIWYKKQQHFNQIICNSGILSLWRFEDLPIKQISWNSNSFLDISLWHLKLKIIHVKSFNRLNIASFTLKLKVRITANSCQY